MEIAVTKEMLLGAKDYVPILRKKEIAEQIAQDSITKVQMMYIPTGKQDAEPCPDRFQEIPAITRLNLMGVLLKEYLGYDIETNEEAPYRIPANLYDMYAENHIVNQIERYRGDKEVCEKAWNLLTDFRDLRSMVFKEIETLLGHNNDVVYRLMDGLQTGINNTVAETMPDVMTKAQEMSDNIPVPKTAEEAKELYEATKQKLAERISKYEELRDKLNEAYERIEGEGNG